MNHKTVTDFYQDIAIEKLDANSIIDRYVEMKKKETEINNEILYRSAEGYSIHSSSEDQPYKEDVLVILYKNANIDLLYSNDDVYNISDFKNSSIKNKNINNNYS